MLSNCCSLMIRVSRPPGVCISGRWRWHAQFVTLGKKRSLWLMGPDHWAFQGCMGLHSAVPSTNHPHLCYTPCLGSYLHNYGTSLAYPGSLFHVWKEVTLPTMCQELTPSPTLRVQVSTWTLIMNQLIPQELQACRRHWDSCQKLHFLQPESCAVLSLAAAVDGV